MLPASFKASFTSLKPARALGSWQFEMAGVPEDVAREAMRLASHKLPIKCKFVKKEAAAPAAEGGEANES